jgi:hypothetical protein
MNSGSVDLSTDFSETPFRYLRGIELGMTGKRLHELRPDARYAPYLGLQEKLPGYTVSYQLPTSMETSAKDVAPDDHLQGVFISELFESMDKAETAWRERVGAVTSRHHAPVACETFPGGGMQARWVVGTKALAIGVFPRERIAPTVTDRVVYAVSSVKSLKQPAGATKVACPGN